MLTRLSSLSLLEKTVYLLAFLFFVLLSYLAIAKHQSYHSGRFDLGLHEQAIWSAARGDWRQSVTFNLASLEIPGNFSWFGVHFTPYLYLIAPFYKFLGQSTEFLLILQPLQYALTGVLLFWLARKFLSSEILAFVLTLAYFLYFPLHFAILTDIHEMMLAYFFIFLSVYALVEGKNRLLLVSSLLAISSKDEIALLYLGIGLYLALWQKRYRLGFFLSGFSLIWFLLASLVIVSYFRQAPSYASYLLPESGQSLISHWLQIGLDVVSPRHLFFVAYTLGPVLFLPLLGGRVFWVSSLLWLLYLINPNPNVHRLKTHYMGPLAPFVWVGVIFGLQRAAWLIKTHWARLAAYPLKEVLAAAVFLGCLVTASLASLLPGSYYYFKAFHEWYEKTPATEKLDTIVKSIPPEAVVSAEDLIGAHLSRRETIYLFPFHYNEADYVLINRERTDYTQGPKRMQEIIRDLNNRSDYELILDEGPYLGYKRR